MGKYIIVQNGSSTGLKTYLERDAGIALWAYHQSLGIWISKRELTPQELAAVIAVGGGHYVAPLSSITSSLV